MVISKILRNFRGDPETWVLNCNLSLWKRIKGFNLTSKVLRIHPDFSFGFHRRCQRLYFYSLWTVKPKPSLFPPGLSNLISLCSLCSTYGFLFSWNFPPSMPLLKLLCSNCFGRHSFCSVRSNLNASVLHEVFHDFSSPPKCAFLSTLQPWNVLLRWLLCYSDTGQG